MVEVRTLGFEVETRLPKTRHLQKDESEVAVEQCLLLKD